MANLFPIILLGGAAALVMSKKKKKKSASVDTTPTIEQPDANLPPMVEPPKKKKAGSTTWKKRQQSLEDAGYDVGKAGVDGKPGPATRKAIMEFQKDAGITIDAKWGAQTAAAMAHALRMVFEGLGKGAYSQIGKIVGKFSDMFKSWGKGKEESTDLGTIDVSGLEPTDAEVQTDQLRALAAIYENPLLDPDKHSVEDVLKQLQGIHGLKMTGRWDLATRILVNELLTSDDEAEA